MNILLGLAVGAVLAAMIVAGTYAACDRIIRGPKE